MTFRYFENELRYLHEAGKAFAEAYPEPARYLNVDSLADRDPYVERLFEGFAFLTGRVHERLDDDLPEYTQQLVGLLYPHFLRPVPSSTIVELRPRSAGRGTVRIERGLEVQSDPVGADRVACRFTTSRPVRLQPLTIKSARIVYTPDEKSRLQLAFELSGGVSLTDLDLPALPLYLHADPTTASALYLFCTRYAEGLRLVHGDGNVEALPFLWGGEKPAELLLRGAQWVRPGGLEPEEALVPPDDRVPSGLRLLQEYMAFRRKFLFVDLLGLDRFDTEGQRAFTVEVLFDRVFPEDRPVRTDHVRLHCAPAVNLFEVDAEPLRADRRVAEYRVIPDLRLRQSVEAYDVREVVGMDDVSGARRAYAPYLAFRTERAGPRYLTTRRIGPTGRPDIFLQLVDDAEPALRGETLSIRLRCTNGAVPREALQEGSLTRPAPEAASLVEVTNLTQPTLIQRPPLQEHQGFLWSLLSHWSFNHLSVASPEALRGLLQLYDWGGSEGHQRRLEGIRGVRWAPAEVFTRGGLLRGSEVILTVQEGHFADDGDLCLFGLVLSQVLSLYATINSFVHLTIEVVPSGRQFTWKPSRGTQGLL
jgi:type VI secretion system protein ImpG